MKSKKAARHKRRRVTEKKRNLVCAEVGRLTADRQISLEELIGKLEISGLDVPAYLSLACAPSGRSLDERLGDILSPEKTRELVALIEAVPLTSIPLVHSPAALQAQDDAARYERLVKVQLRTVNTFEDMARGSKPARDLLERIKESLACWTQIRRNMKRIRRALEARKRETAPLSRLIATIDVRPIDLPRLVGDVLAQSGEPSDEAALDAALTAQARQHFLRVLASMPLETLPLVGPSKLLSQTDLDDIVRRLGEVLTDQ